MAKTTGGVNKSAAIREYVMANPEAKPKEIIDAMRSQGIEVTSAFVSTVKSKAIGGGRKKKARKTTINNRPDATAAASAATNGNPGEKQDGLSLDHLLKAKKMAAELGGMAKARAALDALDKIVR